MKKSLLKITAALLTLVLVFSCCISFNASATGEPTITVIGNNDEPAAAGTSATIKLSGINLSSVKGMDLTLNAPDGVSFSSMSGSFTKNGSTKITLTQNTNYTLTSSKIRIVATFVKNPVDTLSAVIGLKVPSSLGNISVPLGDVTLVNDSVAKIASNGFFKYSGELIVGKMQAASATLGSALPSLSTESLKSEGVFVPYGGIYVDNGNNSYTYPKKNADGSFATNNSSSYIYTKFKLPTNSGKVTTFSSSKRLSNPGSSVDYERVDGVQFVSYALDRSQTHGTILFKGDFDALFESMRGTYATKQALIQACADRLMKRPNKQFYSVGSGVLVCRTEQVKAMWSDSNNDDGPIQYALRVVNVKNAETYTAVGYTYSGGTCSVSEEYQTYTFTN